MREFFKPWRRKLGVVTLALACVFTAAWVRSIYVEDCFSLPIRSAPTILFSRPSGMALATEDAIPPVDIATKFMWAAEPAVDKPSKDVFGELGPLDWRFDFIGFHFCESLNNESGTGFQIKWYVIPYWSLVLPLTLISAYLLLSKPRSRVPKTTEPTPTTGP